MFVGLDDSFPTITPEQRLTTITNPAYLNPGPLARESAT